MKNYNVVLTDEYSVGDLILLTPSNIIYSYDYHNCECGPGTPTRFGFSASNDGTPAIIINIKTDPDYGCEIIFLVGLEHYYMTHATPGDLPYLNVIKNYENEENLLC